MKKNSVAFRSSVGGYNKKDVYNYLEQLNKEIIEKDESLEKEIEALKAENSDLKKQNDIIAQDLTAEKENSRKFENESIEKSMLIDELNSSIADISIKTSELSDEYSSLCEKYEELLNTVSVLKRKADAYDKIAARAKASSESYNASSYIKKPVSNEDRVKNDIDSILYDSAEQMLEYIKTTQQRFNEAIMSVQSDTDALKARINCAIDASKEKIISKMNSSQN